MIEDNYIALNLKKNNPFILIFPKKIEEENNSSDTNINNSFIKISTISPLPLEYEKYINIFSKLKTSQLSDHTLIKYTINTENAKSLYKPIYNLSTNKFNTLRNNLKKLLKKNTSND